MGDPRALGGWYRSLIDELRAQVFVADPEGRFIDANRRAAMELQWEMADLLHGSVVDLVETISLGGPHSPFTMDFYRTAFERAAGPDDTIVFGRNLRRDGSSYKTEVWLQRLSVDDRKLLLAVERKLEPAPPLATLPRPRAGSGPPPPDRPEDLLRLCPSLGELRARLAVLARVDSTVLITGETGVGKELVAAAIHRLSPRAGGPFVACNCASFQGGLADSALFGHERGAFTGAVQRQLGTFERAHGGTLFLDEVGELCLEAQAKLLRVLQDGQFERVGGARTLSADTRVVAATNRDLGELALAGKFRPDLYFRLDVVPLHVPPLRQRREDLPVLAAYFLHRLALRFGRPAPLLGPAAMERLLAHDWPGNVRELAHVLERAFLFSSGPQLDLGSWAEPLAPAPRGLATSARTAHRFPTLEEMERRHIGEALAVTGWRVSGPRGAARLLGMKPTTLEYRMQKLGIRRPSAGS